MSRGMKGCYVYSTNRQFLEYLRIGIDSNE
jgi:hypothetical protein